MNVSLTPVDKNLIRSKTMSKRMNYQLLKVEEEIRKKLSRDFHDEIAQALTYIILVLQKCQAQVKGKHVEIKKDLKALEEFVADELSELHRIAQDLHPQYLEQLGLASAIQHFLEQCSKTSTTNFRFKVEGDVERLSSVMQINILRIIQEALCNTKKHAKAENAAVFLTVFKKQALIIIEDDGVGFDLKKLNKVSKKKARLGIRGMKERAQMLDGTLEIKTAPGESTKIKAQIPLYF